MSHLKRLFGISRRTQLKSVFQLSASQGRAGVPLGVLNFMKKNPKWKPFINRLDHKYSHRVMRRNGTL